MPRPGRLTQEAADWLSAEIDRIRVKNPYAAQRLSQRIRKARRLLAEQPGIAVPGLVPGSFIWKVIPYVFTLGKIGRGLRVIAIRHSKQGDALEPKEAHSFDPEPDPEGSYFVP